MNELWDKFFLKRGNGGERERGEGERKGKEKREGRSNRDMSYYFMNWLEMAYDIYKQSLFKMQHM